MLKEIVLRQFDVNFDGDFRFVEGIVESEHSDIPSGQFIRTQVFGNAIPKVDEILSHSWAKIGTDGHIPVPYRSYVTLDDNLKVVDLRYYDDENS